MNVFAGTLAKCSSHFHVFIVGVLKHTVKSVVIRKVPRSIKLE